MESCFQLEGFSNFKRLVNTVKHVQQALRINLFFNIAEREKTKTIIIQLIQQKKFWQNMKSLKAEKEVREGMKL